MVPSLARVIPEFRKTVKEITPRVVVQFEVVAASLPRHMAA
jgi:hypothetical protein